jgi:hypothetical protein
MNEGVPARHARRVDRSSAIRRVAIVDLVGLTTATMTSPPPRATGPGAMPRARDSAALLLRGLEARARSRTSSFPVAQGPAPSDRGDPCELSAPVLGRNADSRFHRVYLRAGVASFRAMTGAPSGCCVR